MERMMRNRESAANSRKRKKAKVEELEALVASLKEEVQSLKRQNVELRSECMRFAPDSSSPALVGCKPEAVEMQTAPLVPQLPSCANSAACA